MKKAYFLPLMLLLGVFGLFYTIPITPVTAASVTHYYEDFENGLSNLWTASGDWHIEDNATSNYPITDPSVTIPSGTHYMWFGDNTTGTYNNVTGYLTWGPLDLSGIFGKIEVSYYGWLYHWNEYLDVQYSPNGVDWYYPFSGWFSAHTVKFSQLSFEVPHYGKSSTFYFRFRFLQNTLYGESEFGWRIDDVAITETPDYAIEFEQMGDEHAAIEETRHLGYVVRLLYSASQQTEIMLNITSPSGIHKNIIIDHVTLTYLDKWYYDHDYTFTEEGNYNITIQVKDEEGNHFSASKIWKVGPYVIMFRLDTRYFANIGESHEMKFMIRSIYDVDTNFNIKVQIETPTGTNFTIYEEDTLIPAFDEYHFSAPYTFLENGYHRVFISAIDEGGTKFDVYDSSWKIGPYFAAWIENIERYEERYVGEAIPFNAVIDARTFRNVAIDIIIEIIDPDYNVERLYEESNVNFTPSEIWNKSFTYTSTKAGTYQIDILMVNSSNPSEFWWADRWEWFAVEELTLSIDQINNQTELDTEESMTFKLVNHFGQVKEIDIRITIETPSDVETLLHDETITLQPGESWSKTISYTFQERGKYDVKFSVVDVKGKEWVEESWWRVPNDDGSIDTTHTLTSPGNELLVGFIAIIIFSLCIRLNTKKNNR
jgi:hypothetical protein